MIARGLGCRPDSPGARGNWDASERLGASNIVLPERVDWTAHIDWIRHQGASNACLGFAFARALQLSRRVQDAPQCEMPSPLHIYDLARGVQGRLFILGLNGGQEQEDGGAAPEFAAIALERYGFCPESACPWDEARVRQPLKMHEYMGGISRRAVLAHRITDEGQARLQAIRAAITLGHGGIIGIDVDNAFVDWTNVVPWTGIRGARLGGHALAWVGYDPLSLWIVNSWGDDWGDEGIARIAWNVIASENTRSVWVVDSIPSFVPQRF